MCAFPNDFSSFMNLSDSQKKGKSIHFLMQTEFIMFVINNKYMKYWQKIQVLWSMEKGFFFVG
jgi:hypothetical protein